MMTNSSYRSTPFLVSVYSREGKSPNIDTFLTLFLNELHDLQHNNIIAFNGKPYPVRVHAFICDASARS